ncbi:hypothetical protein KKC94_05385 [Patescibacteria group bacterium]|nr:hypothetical protein [Patescibacteria group bacterium]
MDKLIQKNFSHYIWYLFFGFFRYFFVTPSILMIGGGVMFLLVMIVSLFMVYGPGDLAMEILGWGLGLLGFEGSYGYQGSAVPIILAANSIIAFVLDVASFVYYLAAGKKLVLQKVGRYIFWIAILGYLFIPIFGLIAGDGQDLMAAVIFSVLMIVMTFVSTYVARLVNGVFGKAITS